MAIIGERKEQDLFQIFEKITNIPNKAITDTIKQINDENLNQFDYINQVSEYINVYCTKTGQLIRQRTDQELTQLVKIHGASRAKTLLSRQNLQQVAAHWIYTDGVALENLSKFDPISYFVYSIFLILPQCRLPIKTNDTFDDTQWKMESLRARVALHEKAKEFPQQEIIKTNEYLRRYLSLIDTLKARTIVKFPVGMPIDLFSCANDLGDFNSLLIDNMCAVIKHEYFNGGIQTITYDTALQIKTNYAGFAAYRAQKRISAMSEVDDILLGMKDILTEEQLQKEPWVAASLQRPIPAKKKEKKLYELPTNFKLEMSDVGLSKVESKTKLSNEQAEQTAADFTNFLKGLK